MRPDLTSAAEILGLVAILVASFALDWRAGLAVVGVVLVALGYLAGDEETPS